MLRRLAQRFAGRSAILFVAAAALVVATLATPDAQARGHDEWHAAEHSSFVSDRSVLKQAQSMPGKREALPIPDDGSTPRLAPRVARRTVRLRVAPPREVPLPPARMRYRRAVHDEQSDPPA